MKYFLYLFLLSVLLNCQNLPETVADSSRQLEEAWLEGSRSLSNKLSSFTRKKIPDEDIQKNLDSIKERLDFLERNMLSKSDLDSSIEALRREWSAIEKNKTKAEEKPVKEKTLLEQAQEHFKNENWKQAIFAYEEFRKKEPQSDQFPSATLNIGLSFQKLGLKEEAKVFFQEVIDQFPNSKSAGSARQALKQ